MACGQRSRKRQPRGRLARVGHVAADRQRLARLVDIGHRHGRDQRPGVGMQRPAHDLLGRPVLDDAAEIHHQGALADVTHQREVVGDVDGGQAHASRAPRASALRMPARTLTSSIETGSSATRKRGPSTSARASTTRCSCPPRQLVRIACRDSASTSAQLDAAEAPRRCGRRCSALAMPALISGSATRAVDGEARVERVERVLEDELRLAAEVAQPLAGQPGQRSRRRSVIAPRGRLDQLQQQAAQSWSCRSPIRPARPTLSPSPTSKLDAVDRVHGRMRAARRSRPACAAPGSASRRREARRALPCRWPPCGCSEGSSASPSRRQAAQWSAPMPLSGGSTLQAAAEANGQRGAKRQPGGRLAQVGRAAVDRHQLQRGRARRSGKALRRPIV